MTLERNATIKLNVKARGAEVALRRVSQEIGKVGDRARRSSSQTDAMGRSLERAAHRGNLVAVAMRRIGTAGRTAFGPATRAIDRMHRSFRAFDVTQRRAAIRGSLSARGYVTLREGALGAGRAFRGLASDARFVAATARNAAFAFGTVSVAAAAISAPFIYAVRQAGRLEEAMARVAAVSGASVNQLGALGRQARQLGAATSFTAEQVAQAMENLARAGYSTPAIQAAIPSVLNLARGNNISTDDAGSLLASTTRSFRLDIGDESNARAVADLLSQTAAASNVSTETLRETLRYSGSTFASLGDGSQAGQQAVLREQLTLAGLLGNQGVQGSVAGTALKNIQLRFAGAGREALNGLGVDSFDRGNYRGTTAIIGDLRQALQGSTQEESIGALEDIAGRLAMPALQALLNTDPREFGRLARTLEDADGAAERMRVTMEDTLLGDWELLTSAIDGLAISIGDDLLPATRGAMQGLSDFISTVTAVRESFGGPVEDLGGPDFGNNDGLSDILTLGFARLIEIGAKTLDFWTGGSDETVGMMLSTSAAMLGQLNQTKLDRINRDRDIAIGNVGREQASQIQARERRVTAAQDLDIGAGSSATTLLARFDSIFGQDEITGTNALAMRERIAAMGSQALTAEQATSLRAGIVGALVQDQQIGNASSEQDGQRQIAGIYSEAQRASGVAGTMAIQDLASFEDRTGHDTSFLRSGLATTRDAASGQNVALRDRALANVQASQDEGRMATSEEQARATADVTSDLHGLSRESQEAVRQLVALGVAAEQATTLLRAAGRAPTGAPTGASEPGET